MRIIQQQGGSVTPDTAALFQAETDCCAREGQLKRKYDYAASRPWLSVPPDPPEPK
jgi:hypothetical protein